MKLNICIQNQTFSKFPQQNCSPLRLHRSSDSTGFPVRESPRRQPSCQSPLEEAPAGPPHWRPIIFLSVNWRPIIFLSVNWRHHSASIFSDTCVIFLRWFLKALYHSALFSFIAPYHSAFIQFFKVQASSYFLFWMQASAYFLFF
jgi:hypothetical protein